MISISLQSVALNLHLFVLQLLDPECDHPDQWTSHKTTMAHLQVVELIRLAGTDCELWFMKAVLTSARGRLRKVDIHFNPLCQQRGGKMDQFERMLLDEGTSTSRREEFRLTTCMNL